ncbi:phosphatase PAP2 family protein [Altererythrobacter arenosus]|uniref:Phosphatase PAP2 family protein n=1 Tax=Altererythrobacter arenosus TaxID=3032592 RepID=A0ABY8FS91_9SPHN|nr:phosphatase PAP2 family protein [Altererythrobacter sp. CAU 1644]WFL77873.1 phosphatase PAP2 family protein [Altererythrobacter sp. CAU 1644]
MHGTANIAEQAGENLRPVRLRNLRIPLEIGIALAFLAFTLAVSNLYGLPFSLPSGERAAFVGVHYLYPLIGIAIWAAIMVFSRREEIAATFFVALPAYALVLLCHFNLKLWIPHLNPALWDETYWATDQAIRPAIEASMAIRTSLDPVIPLESNFYMIGFIVLFYIAFGFACLKRPESFRELVLAAIILQIMGSFAYLVAPALGPFLYEAGVEPPATLAQQSMLASWQANVAGGGEWIAAEGGRQLTVGLAAMPSLHAGGSFLFLLYALRHARKLAIPFALLFAFISLDAIANRWHYAIDLPVGMALAAVATWLAVRLVRRRDVSAPAKSRTA